MEFNFEKLSKVVIEATSRKSVRSNAEDIGVSSATFHRVTKGNEKPNHSFIKWIVDNINNVTNETSNHGSIKGTPPRCLLTGR